MTFVKASFISSIVSKRQPLAQGIAKSHRDQVMDDREAEELSWRLSWSNSLWHWPSCGQVHCPSGNATDPIWTVLASSLVTLTLTFGQSTLVYWLPYSSLTFHRPSQTPCLPWISYATEKLMLDSCKMVEKQSKEFHTCLWLFFSKFKTEFYCISFF